MTATDTAGSVPAASAMSGFERYLTEHCCQGGVCEVTEFPHCDC